jgi:hypothetical protein
MNGDEPKIEIFKPFGEAFELTKKILFQPFDLRKWCVIGFAAFLAHLGSGFNFNYNYNRPAGVRQLPAGTREILDALHQIPVWLLVLGVVFLVTLILAMMVVFAWLRARGRFMFIDCIVKNRGAIAEQWREFHEQGNSYFLFSLLVGCGFFILAALLSLPFMLPIVRGVTFLHLHDAYLFSMVVLWGLVLLLISAAWGVIGHFMIMIMYCGPDRAVEAFRSAVRLMCNFPGEITLYCLFWVVLSLAAIVVGCAAVCATCCLVAIPYVGTVILLPLFVCLRSFGLCFLRQFGVDYDAWQKIQPASARSISSPPIPPMPPPLPA